MRSVGNRQQAQMLLTKGAEAAADRSQPTNQDHAYQLMASACYSDPTWSEAFYANGCNASDLERPHASVALFRRSLECEFPTLTHKAKALTNLGWGLTKIGRHREAVPFLHQAIELDGRLQLPWMILSLCHTAFGDTETAVSCATKCMDMVRQHNPDDATAEATAEFAMAFALLYDGKYAEGLKAFESRFRHRLHNFLLYPYPKWRGERDKTLFLVADQGLGDTLSYSRFVEAASKRCRYMHMCVQSELRRVFEHAFRHLQNINFMPSPSNFPGDADAWSTFVSLPFALGLSDDEIKNAPPIDMPRPPMLPAWKVADRKFHIGIAWSGSPLNDIDKHRNISLHHFLELYRVPGIQLYGLQADARKDQIGIWGCAPLIRPLEGFIRDVADTASILQHLDLVVTVESALGHICSMVGMECWIPYSWLGRDYRAGVFGEQKLWTPKTTFFQQSDDCRWEPVFERIVRALQEKVHGTVDEAGVLVDDIGGRIRHGNRGAAG
jgi:tetratricopeptide (TPR) repeat protein